MNGFGAGILWVSQGQYISMCANDTNKGSYNSIFWAIFQSSSLIGGLLSSFVIVKVKQSTFYLLMTVICILASLFLLLLKEPYKHPTQERRLADASEGPEVIGPENS